MNELNDKEIAEIEEIARQLRNHNSREWRKNNKDKVREINKRYWEKKAKEYLKNIRG